jgi:hypothetical protein
VRAECIEHAVEVAGCPATRKGGRRGLEPKHPQLSRSHQTLAKRPMGRKPDGSGIYRWTPQTLGPGAGVPRQYLVPSRSNRFNAPWDARFGGARADADTAKVLAIRRASCTVKTFATSTGRRVTCWRLSFWRAGRADKVRATRRPPSPVTKDARPEGPAPLGRQPRLAARRTLIVTLIPAHCQQQTHRCDAPSGGVVTTTRKSRLSAVCVAKSHAAIACPKAY